MKRFAEPSDELIKNADVTGLRGADRSPVIAREQSLENENGKLHRLGTIARRLLATLDARELVERMHTGVRELTGGEAAVYAPRFDGWVALTGGLEVSLENGAYGDDLISRAAARGRHVIDSSGTRAAVPASLTAGSPHFIIQVTVSEGQTLREGDCSALELLGQYFVVAARNVELYGELNSRRASAIELNELKSDLIATLAHDLNGPLTTIIGFAEILSGESLRTEEDRECLRTISRAATRLAHLATDTLALSSLERNDIPSVREPVDVVGLVRDVAASLEGRRKVYVRTHLKSAVISADETRLRQVFYNVIHNAIKYSPSSPEVHVSIKREGKELHIDVVDFGIGIPSGETAALFKRFARASNARGLGIAGSGFGLYLVKKMLESQGGYVTVPDRADKGTTFRVHLPFASGHVKRRACRVLIGEPQSSYSFLAHVLRSGGCMVDSQSTAQGLLKRLADGNYEYVVIDMPGISLSHVETDRLEQLKTSKQFKVIALSADDAEIRDGFTPMLKPFLVRDLLAAVDSPLSKKP